MKQTKKNTQKKHTQKKHTKKHTTYTNILVHDC